MSGPLSEAMSVLLNDVVVGTLVWFSPDKTVFTLNETYINSSDRPTLTLVFRTKDRDQLSDMVWKANLVLCPFFSNLLPEGPLRSYLADLNGINPQREYFLLKALREDLPGAVRLAPTDGAMTPIDLPDEPLTAIEGSGGGLRFSLGGVQLKFSALLDASGGLTIPVNGTGGSWIVKLASNQYPQIPENEFSMMELARHCGLEIPRVELKNSKDIRGLPSGLPKHFNHCYAVKRFDRQETTRVHIEDFCQVFNVSTENKYSKNFNYNHMAALIWRYLGEADLIEFIRRLVFNIGIANTDMHLKNWSLIYPDGVHPRLAPGYDFVSTRIYVEHDELALKLGDVRHMKQVGRQTFDSLIKIAKLPPHLVLKTVEEFVNRFLDTWATVKHDLPIPSAVRASIESHLEEVPLFSFRSSFSNRFKL